MSDAPAGTLSPGQVYRRLLGYAMPHRGMFAIGIFGMVLFAGTDAAFAAFVKYFLREAFVEPQQRALWTVPLSLLALFFLRGAGEFLATYFPGAVGRQVIKSVRRDLFEHALHLPAAYYDRGSVAPLLSRLTYNVELVAEVTTNSIATLIRDTLTIAGLLAFMLWQSWQLTLLALIVAPLIGSLVRGINTRFRRYSSRIQNSVGDVTRVAKEALEGQRVIKVFTAEAQQLRRFEAVNELNRHSNVRLISAKAASSPIVQLVGSVGLAAVLFVAISQVLDGGLQVDDFLSFITALLLLMQPLRRLVNVSGPLQQGIAAGQSVFEVLDQAREPVGGTHVVDRVAGHVSFDGVGFAYDPAKGRVLDDIRLEVPAGQTVALVGRSGSGKSTLAALVPRFYDPDVGAVKLDGVDVRDFRLDSLRRQVSYVGQDVLLFDDSIRNNIAFGLDDVSDERIRDAARAARVLEFAESLPQGLDTPVGERGAMLSGGQRQRVAIARALLKDAPVLILDEATSALDSESERHIQEALAILVRNRTTLVIAHRLSTIEHADLIVVMSAGRIAERGTHAELLAAGGLYAQLHRLQFDA
jgi:ATP-binding cassette, subfamily B, bacterial MsbA